MSSGGNMRWCHQCRRLIRPRIEGMGCSNCDGGFVQELSELADGCVRDSLDRFVGNMEAFDLSRFRSNREYRLELYCNALVTCSLLRARHLMHRYSSLWSTMMPVDSNRFGLNELIERILIEVQSSLPAPVLSAIDAMLTIKITPTHIESDSHSHCPVCKDQFELGTEVMQTPCNHIYHSDCIIPWLLRHNTCPVCRHQLGSRPISCRQSSSRRRTSSNSREGGSNVQDTSRRHS